MSKDGTTIRQSRVADTGYPELGFWGQPAEVESFEGRARKEETPVQQRFYSGSTLAPENNSIPKEYADLFDPPASLDAIFPTTRARPVAADLAIVDNQGLRGGGR